MAVGFGFGVSRGDWCVKSRTLRGVVRNECASYGGGAVLLLLFLPEAHSLHDAVFLDHGLSGCGGDLEGCQAPHLTPRSQKMTDAAMAIAGAKASALLSSSGYSE
jgi:hypothetical protein